MSSVASGTEKNQSLKKCNRGYLIVNEEKDDLIPSYVKDWNKRSECGFSFYTHPKQKLFMKKTETGVYFLIGHAYDPFTKCINEDEILEQIVQGASKSSDAELDIINSLTGIFVIGKIDNGIFSVILDCAGMMGAYYAVIDENVVVTSHTVMISEMFGLAKSDYVKKLLQYKFYPLYGSFLPGDITPYDEAFRVVPNTEVKIDLSNKSVSINRFYPNKELQMVKSEDEYMEQLEKIASILKASLELTSKKWAKPAISLTGGMDSKTTLSSAINVYDKFSYFSYISSKAEKLDADAAHDICNALGLNHKIYEISPSPDEYPSFVEAKEILAHSKDYIGKNNTNDICKRIYFEDTDDFDVEVKSWVSEIARANYYKKFEKKKMPKKITPRRCSSMYKIFLHNRGLLRQTDKIFKEYIEKTELEKKLYNFDWSDMFLWEIRYGAWGGLVITSEHKYSFDITIPYNNRKLLELMLAMPLEKRRKDILHQDLIKLMNKKIHDTGISVVNMNETKFRAFCEKCYFNINTHLPF